MPKPRVQHKLPLFLNTLFLLYFVETVAIDLLQLSRSRQNSTYMLGCVDHFNRLLELAPLFNKTPAVVAHALVSHHICPCTTPFFMERVPAKGQQNNVKKNFACRKTL